MEFLNDIVKNNRNFLTLEELNKNFNMNVILLDYVSIQNAIPRELRRSLLSKIEKVPRDIRRACPEK